MLHNQQGYMMYPMMDQNQAYQWNQYNYDQSQQNLSVDSARGKSHGHSKSSSHDKDPKNKMSPKVVKKNNNNNTLANNNNQAPANNNQHQQAAAAQLQQYPQSALNQFVPVYMLPPGFAGHPGAFNAALAAHAAQQQQQGGNNSANIQQAQAAAAAANSMYQLPTYGHYPYGIQVPYGFQMPNQAKQAYYNPSGYSGSDYNSASHSAHSHTDSSHRGSKSTDSMSKRNSRSLTSKDSATHSTGASNKGHRKSSGHVKNMKKNNTKKFQSTHQINIQKGAKAHAQHQHQHQAVKLQNSCGRSHSVGSDLSAGCSASACQPNNGLTNNNNVQNLRSCSHESHPDSGRTSNHSNEKRKISGCCSSECDHHGPIFQNMRKFSNNQDFKKPDGELTKKLIELIEFYLSDEYLAKDKYLLRQIRCKSEGYISIKLMTSFKKVKKLTRDWRSVRFALLQSPNLIVSPEGFRVKRATQLPENLRKPRLLSSVVTIRLTEELSAVDALTSKFSKYGEIGLVRILKPGKEIPSDLRNYATQVPDIGKTMCAVVDFEQSESALQAVRCLKDELMNDKMRLALLGPRVRRTLYKQDRPDDENDDDAEIDDAEIAKNIQEALNLNPTDQKDQTVQKEPLEQQDTIKPETVSYKNAVTSDNKKIKRVESNESNTTNCTSTTNKSLDLSVDSGNCAASGGTASNDEDLKALISDKNVTMKKDSKLNSIIRQPEGPGANPVLSGFAYKRSLF